MVLVPVSRTCFSRCSDLVRRPRCRQFDRAVVDGAGVREVDLGVRPRRDVGEDEAAGAGAGGVSPASRPLRWRSGMFSLPWVNAASHRNRSVSRASSSSASLTPVSPEYVSARPSCSTRMPYASTGWAHPLGVDGEGADLEGARLDRVEVEDLAHGGGGGGVGVRGGQALFGALRAVDREWRRSGRRRGR